MVGKCERRSFDSSSCLPTCKASFLHNEIYWNYCNNSTTNKQLILFILLHVNIFLSMVWGQIKDTLWPGTVRSNLSSAVSSSFWQRNTTPTKQQPGTTASLVGIVRRSYHVEPLCSTVTPRRNRRGKIGKGVSSGIWYVSWLPT